MTFTVQNIALGTMILVTSLLCYGIATYHKRCPHSLHHYLNAAHVARAHGRTVPQSVRRCIALKATVRRVCLRSPHLAACRRRSAVESTGNCDNEDKFAGEVASVTGVACDSCTQSDDTNRRRSGRRSRPTFRQLEDVDRTRRQMVQFALHPSTYQFNECGARDYLACSSLDWRYRNYRLGGLLHCYKQQDKNCPGIIDSYNVVGTPYELDTWNVCSAGRLAQCVKPCASHFYRAESVYEGMRKQDAANSNLSDTLDVDTIKQIMDGRWDISFKRRTFQKWHQWLQWQRRQSSQYSPCNRTPAQPNKTSDCELAARMVRSAVRQAAGCLRGEQYQFSRGNCTDVICGVPDTPLGGPLPNWKRYLAAKGRRLFHKCPPDGKCSLSALAAAANKVLFEEEHQSYQRPFEEAVDKWLRECAPYRHKRYRMRLCNGGIETAWRLRTLQLYNITCILDYELTDGEWQEYMTMPCALIFATRLRTDIWSRSYSTPFLPDLATAICQKRVAIAASLCNCCYSEENEIEILKHAPGDRNTPRPETLYIHVFNTMTTANKEWEEPATPVCSTEEVDKTCDVRGLEFIQTTPLPIHREATKIWLTPI